MGKHILLIGVSAGELATENIEQSPAIVNVTALKKTLLTEIEDLRDSQVITLINPNLRQMRHAIALMTYRCRRGDLCLIYYAGCGVLDINGTIYLPASDTRLETISTTAISSDYIRQALPSIKEDLYRVMILDCLWGALPGRHTLMDAEPSLPLHLADCNCALLTAMGSPVHPWPITDAGVSLYTQCLIDGITTGLADIDADGGISLQDLQTYMEQSLKTTSAQLVSVAVGCSSDNAQIPLLSVPAYAPEREYRRSIESYAHRHRGQIPLECRNILEFLRHQLGITLEQSQTIETQVLAPYAHHQASRERYRQAFTTALSLENPLGNPLKKWLRHLQGKLSLSYEDVAAIESPILTQHQPSV
ncbi:MAG: hypothetical protein F6K31_35180, partial [Symploca sp. SIO2G7]|nr:hypothetical protein [Symploca sp. SIO2G7]